MSTQAQMSANQANSQHSTGPRTENGKATVAANAITHGATSKQAFIKGEDLTGYESSAAKFRDEFKPVTVHEEFLVKRMADSAWRLQRLQSYEMQLIEQCCSDANPFEDNDQFKKLNRAHRYTQSIERSYHVAHRELVAARKPEKGEKEPEPKQTQIPVKCFPHFDKTWNGKVNISKKNPAPSPNTPFSLRLGGLA